MIVINPLTVKDREPGGGFYVFAPVFVPFYVGFAAEDIIAFVCALELKQPEWVHTLSTPSLLLIFQPGS